MPAQKRSFAVAAGVLALGWLFLLSACSPEESGTGAWIDHPRDGSLVQIGLPQSVISHGFNREGITEIVLIVNGEAYRRDAPDPPGGDFTSIEQEWTPQVEGLYSLQVIVYDTAGKTAHSDPVTVKVVDKQQVTPVLIVSPTVPGLPDLAINEVVAEIAGDKDGVSICYTRVIYTNQGDVPIPAAFSIQFDFDGSPTQILSSTLELDPGITAETIFVHQFDGEHEINITLDPTNLVKESNETNNNSAELVRCGGEPAISIPTPSNTPLPLIQFWAEPITLKAGGCTSVKWHVENAQAVLLDGVGKPLDGSIQDCLCSDQSYTLTVVLQDGSQVERQVDVNVSGTCATEIPPDITPPPVPLPSVPQDQLQVQCKATQNLVWMPVTDPSGLDGYFLRLQRRSSPTASWSNAGEWGPINDKQYSVIVECGYYYRWSVRAQDGEGNMSNWSDWSQFSVTLN